MLLKQLLIKYLSYSICIIKFSKNKIQFFLREKDLSKPSKTSLSSFIPRTICLRQAPKFLNTVVFLYTPQKGGDPSPRSRRDTLLRLHPSHLSYLGRPPPLLVRLSTSGITDSHGVTGGVYNTRERIHPDILIRDYQRFQLHRVELQTLIRTGTSFKRFAPCHHVAARCTGHCSTPVALDVRGMMI